MNIRSNLLHHGLKLGALALAVSVATATAQAHEVFLKAAQFDKDVLVQGDGIDTGSVYHTVAMWGYAACEPGTGGNAADGTTWTCGAPSSPGPEIRIPEDDDSLTIHLYNDLPGTNSDVLRKDSSVLIPALPKPLEPLWIDGRVVSFDEVTDQGSVNTYEWVNVPEGTFLYQSGTHIQVQQQMGLYGAIVKQSRDKTRSVPPQAYQGAPYSNEAVLVYSEIDPWLHAIVAGGTACEDEGVPIVATAETYGTSAEVCGKATTSTEIYEPRYFLVNGETSTPEHEIVVNGTEDHRLMLRLVNAGIENHSHQLLGGLFDSIAEDAHVVPVRRTQHTTLLPAAKARDVWFTPTAVNAAGYPFYDRRLRLTNDLATGGGMLVKIRSDASVGPVATDDWLCVQTPYPDSRCTFEGGDVVTGDFNTGQPDDNGAPGILGNDTDANGDPIRFVVPMAVSGDDWTSQLAAAPGSTIPAGATLTVRDGNGANAGRVIFESSDPDWLGHLYFDYEIQEAVPGLAALTDTAQVHIMRDVRVDLAQYTGTDWNLSGQVRVTGSLNNPPRMMVRTAPVDVAGCGLIIPFEGGQGIEVNTNGSWSYGEDVTSQIALPSQCTRLRFEYPMPAVDSGSFAHAHNVAIEVDVTN